MNIELFKDRLREHLRRWTVPYLFVAAGVLWFQAHYAFGLNATPSLPYRFFLIQKGEPPQRGDFVAFRWTGGGPYRNGATFVKILAGMPGDIVAAQGRNFYLNGQSMGEAKPISRDGLALAAGPTGLIPPGEYYVRAPHPDSLDSRYQLTGWIPESRIIGRAYALF